MEELLRAIAAGADVATIAIAVALWRMDVRIVRLETVVFGGHER